MTGRSSIEWGILVVGFVVAIALGVVGWRIGGPHGERLEVDPRVSREYDPATGRLVRLIYDLDGDLIFDTWNYMNDGRVERTDTDENNDGKIDRREYFSADGVLERIEYLGPDGQVVRSETPPPAAKKPQ